MRKDSRDVVGLLFFLKSMGIMAVFEYLDIVNFASVTIHFFWIGESTILLYVVC